jgi:hypothetical protein
MYTECALARPPYPAELVERSRALLAGVLSLMPAGPAARVAAETVLARYPQHAREVERCAREVGVAPVELALANLCYDLSMGLLGCSTLVLAGPDGPVVARNMDWVPEGLLARASCVTELPHGLSAAFVGAVGVVTGLSRRGFAVVLNAVPGPLHPAGYPVLLFLRHLLDEARSFEQAVRLASHTPLASSALLTLAGTDNRQRVCVERSPTEHRQRWAEGDRPLVVTNHYRRLAAPDACPRYDHLERHAPRLPAAPGEDDLLALLTHPDVRQSITAQHVLARPSAGSLRLFVPTALLDPDRPGADALGGLRGLF